MIGQPVQRVRDFFRSMAGHIFVLLTVGISLSAILALAVSEQGRRHDFERVRRQRVLASAFDVADRLRRDPVRVQQMLENHGIVGASIAPDGISINEPDPDLEAALARRFGPRAQPEAGQVPFGLCFPDKDAGRSRAAGLIDAPRPDCWIVRMTDATGQRRGMALTFPRLARPPSSLFSPAYHAPCHPNPLDERAKTPKRHRHKSYDAP